MSSDKRRSAEKEKARALRKTFWWQTKIREGRCEYCWNLLPEGGRLTMDHIVPISAGGITSKGNIAAVCKACNNLKRNSSSVDWFLHQSAQSRL